MLFLMGKSTNTSRINARHLLRIIWSNELKKIVEKHRILVRFCKREDKSCQLLELFSIQSAIFEIDPKIFTKYNLLSDWKEKIWGIRAMSATIE